MQVFLGPFHPYLEDAFVGEVCRYKSSDPLSPLLVLVPSDSIRRRLKTLLVLDHRLDLINLQILTFHQLSRYLYEEQYGASDPELREDIFLEETLRHLIRKEVATGSPFSGLDEMEGGGAALWQTLRDLKDGMVDPVVVIQAVKEGHFGKEAIGKVMPLLNLYLDLRDRCEDWSIRDYTDLDTMVIDQVPSSRFLKQFRHIFHYGFYDLTQVQIEQFRTVAQHYPATLFFPLMRRHPGWIFAERFYDRYVQGLVANASQVIDLIKLHPDEDSVHHRLFEEGLPELQAKGPSCTIISCSGARDETLTVAKEILRLVTGEEISFSDIGVVARNLSAYSTSIMDIFPRHGIPVSSTAQESVVRFPLTKAALLLTGLSLKGFIRSEVIDLFSSPYFDAGSFCPEGIEPQPDLWDGLTRRIGITRGLNGWKRLKRYIDRGKMQRGEKDDGDKTRSHASSFEQAEALWQTFTHLHQDLSGLPVKAGWSDYVAHWKRLFKKYLSLARPEETGVERSQEDHISEAIIDALENLAGLDAVVSPVSMNNFIEIFRRWLARASIPMSDRNISGVSVIDAMAARGLPFKVLFLLGINEGIFPRTIREDAFLRDGSRRAFETVLGYKVGEKLAGYDEEKLLFTLLVGAARERLYCLYQRSDEKGKPLVPSWYLAELRKAVAGNTLAGDGPAGSFNEEGKNGVEERTIPRGLLEKQKGAPFDRADLHTPQELAVQLGLVSRNPEPLFKQLRSSQILFTQGLNVLKQHEQKGKLTPHDGMLGLLPGYWKLVQQKGMTPTGLERYARCPFQYFSINLLGLSSPERPEEITELGPADAGELCHAILKDSYETVMKQNYFEREVPDIDCRNIIEDISQKVFSKYELRNPVGYPVVWEDLNERIVSLVEKVIEQDRGNLFKSGFSPLALEVKCEGRLEGGWPDIIEGLPIHGRLDRIDYHADQKRYRVIDYKYKTGKNQSAQDKDLMQASVRGQRLQPPVYLLLARRYAAEQEKRDVDFPTEAALYFLAPNWDNGPVFVNEFPTDGWEGEAGGILRKTFTLLLKGIHDGRFFILPGNHCDYCDLSAICRKNHVQSKRRAAQDPLTLEHHALRKLKIPKKTTSKKGNPKPRTDRSK